MFNKLINTNAGGGTPENFNTVLYTGTANSLPVTDVGFQPDLIWIKNRTSAIFNPGGTDHHTLIDSVRGTNSQIYANLTNGQNTFTNQISSFDATGFTLGTGFTDSEPGRLVNVSGTEYVAWCWKAAGSANTFNVLENDTVVSGSTTSAVGISTTGSNMTLTGASVNRDKGFSIVTNTGGSSYPEWISHGLGVVPDLVMTKQINNSANWIVNIGANVIDSNDYTLNLNTTADATLQGRQMTSTVVPLTYTPATQSFISYAFKSIPGFSKISSYVGNGNVNGPIVNCGFKPAFVMYKCTSTEPGNWIIIDNKRALTNPRTPHLRANTDGLDDYGPNEDINFLDNGFQPVGVSNYNSNSIGQTYIYMAFAN